MRRFTMRCAAALGAACTLISALTFPAGAAADDLLPSGKKVSQLEMMLDARAEEATTDTDGSAISGSYSLLIFRGDETVLRQTTGDIDHANHIPADSDTVYEWGSISKTMVWVSAMQLWEQGRLDLEADIRGYLPAGFLRHLQYDDPITMLDLMNHTGGWCESTYSFGTRNAAKIRPLGQCLQEGEPAQMFRPGTVSTYSNWGAALAAYVLECVSGEDFCEYVHRHIFEPLGMEHTAIAPDHSDNEWVRAQREKVNCYRSGMINSNALGKSLDFLEAYPAGAATGTIDDLARYARAFVDDSAPLFAHPETQQKMFAGSLFIGKYPVMTHGFEIAERACTIYGHSGATAGFDAEMMFDPVSKYGYVVATNEKNNAYIRNLMDDVFGEKALNLYPAAGGAPLKTDSYYMTARTNLRGIGMYLAYLNDAFYISKKNLDVCAIGENIYAGEGNLLQLVTLEDGSKALCSAASSIVEVRNYIPMMLLFSGYLIAAVVSLFALRIKRMLKKDHRLRAEKGAAVISAAQVMKLISLLFVLTIQAYANAYGLSYTAGKAFGILQMLCAAVCTAAAAVSAVRMLKGEKGRLPMLRNLMNIAGNAVTVCTVIVFQMYQFWAC